MTELIKKPPEEEREKLPAEKKFDQAVYGGISYFAQAATGVALSTWIAHGSGRPIFDKIARWFGTNVLSKITKKTGEAAVDEAHSWIVVTTMIMCGNLFLLPVKWLENHKASIVEKWTEQDNKKREEKGCPLSKEAKETQEKLLAELKAEPKQTWWSLGTGRAFSLAGVYAVLYGIGKPKNAAVADAFSKTIRKGIEAVGLKNASQSKLLDNVLNISFYDIFYSMVSAGGLYVFSHFITPPKDKHPDDRQTPLISAILEPEHYHASERKKSHSDHSTGHGDEGKKSIPDPALMRVDATIAQKPLENNVLINS